MKKQFTFTQNELLARVPESWSEVTFDTYLNKLIKLKLPTSEDPVAVMDANIELASIFVGFEKEIVEQFPMMFIRKINAKLDFLNSKPKPLTKSKYKWISKLEEPSYDDFITFIKISEQIANQDFSNFPLVIKIVLRDELTEEQILQMPMDEIEHGFFLLRKYLMNYLKSTIKDCNVQIIRMKTEEVIQAMKEVEGIQFKTRLSLINKTYKELMASTFSRKKSETSQG